MTSLFGMEDSPRMLLEKKQYPLFISFVEAMMAGNCFCFKPEEQKCRFKKFDDDDFYLVSYQDMTNLFELYKIISQVPVEKNPGNHFIRKYNVILPKTLPEKAELCEKELLVQWVRLQGFNHDKRYKKNRDAFQNALEARNFAHIEQTCFKQTCPYEFTLRECLQNSISPLPEKPVTNRALSLIDAIFQRRLHYVAVNQHIIVPHFKKLQRKYFLPAGNSGKDFFSVFLTEISLEPSGYQKLCAKIMYQNVNHKDYALLLATLSSRQKEFMILGRSILDFFADPLSRVSNFPVKGTSRMYDEQVLLERLSTMDASIRQQLDGFNDIPQEEYPLYIKRIVERNKNRDAFEQAICDENIDDFMQAVKNPLFIKYVPLRDACKV